MTASDLLQAVPAGTAVSIRRLSKSFGDVRALSNIDLDVISGSIHALMGGNGSGKSTLIKCVSGYHQPDVGGEILLGGTRPPGRVPDRRIAVVHQDLGLVPGLSVMENMAIGHGYPVGLAGRIHWSRHRAVVAEQLDRYRVAASPDDLVQDLSPPQRASVAIARALTSREATRLLILDEPTASLQERERDELLAVVRAVAADGAGVLYVSHRIPEVLSVSDTVSVLRDGSLVATRPTGAITESWLVESMMGKAVVTGVARTRHHDPDDVPALQARGVTGPGVTKADLDVAPGEIVGLTGLLGAGQNELGRLLFGAAARTAGEVRVGGRLLRTGDPADAIAAGLAYVPNDRVHESTIRTFSVRENMTLLTLNRFAAGGRLRLRAERAAARRWMDDYDIRPRDEEQLIARLSGGNQQKAVVAKWLESAPAVLVVDEPTHGVDVAARASIYALITEAARAGAAVVLIDTDLDELVRLADRVVVMASGRTAGTLSGPELDRAHLVALTQGMKVAA